MVSERLVAVGGLLTATFQEIKGLSFYIQTGKLRVGPDE